MKQPDQIHLDRIIQFEDIRNFRELGGLNLKNGTMIKKGILFRSGDWRNATERDLKHLSDLGIRTVVDLRSIDAQKRAPNPISSDVSTRLVSLPMVNEAIDIFKKNHQMLKDGQKPEMV